MASPYLAENRWQHAFRAVDRPESPEKPRKEELHTCPYCAQSLYHESSNSWSLLVSGLIQLGAGLVILLRSLFRCARLVVATVLCLFGLLGDTARYLGTRIAHPHDRRILAKLSL